MFFKQYLIRQVTYFSKMYFYHWSYSKTSCSLGENSLLYVCTLSAIKKTCCNYNFRLWNWTGASLLCFFHKGKENSVENYLKLRQKFHSCILFFFSPTAVSFGSLWSLHDSDDTKEASIQPLREDIPARMISSTRRMLVAITVQEWRSCFFTQ